MIEAPEIFARIYDLHGHRCPMSTLGGRLGLAAREQDFLTGPDLRAIYHSRTCALDGIALILGCSEADGNLTVTGEGRHVLELYDEDDNVAELSLSQNAMRIAGDYRRLSIELEQGWDQLDEAERAGREKQREASLDAILPGLWAAPTEELIDIRFGAIMSGQENG